jgi:hypothetical protein
MNAGSSSGPSSYGAWLHLADETRDFDAKLAALVGDAAARHCGASRVLVDKAEWQRHWTQAELDAALRQLDGAVDAPDAWESAEQPQGSLRGGVSDGDDIDEAGATPPAAHTRPACAVRAVAIVQAVCARASVLPHASQQRAFVRDVPAAVAADFLARVQRRAKGASAFGDPAAEDSIRRAAACICAARVLELGLEALAEEPSLWELEQLHAARARGSTALGTGTHAGEGAPSSGIFAEEVAHAQELQHQWLDALAHAMVSQLAADAAPLLGRSAGASDADIKVALDPALQGLAARIRLVQPRLDAVALTALWCVPRVHSPRQGCTRACCFPCLTPWPQERGGAWTQRSFFKCADPGRGGRRRRSRHRKGLHSRSAVRVALVVKQA